MNSIFPDGLPDAPGWPIHPAMLTTTDHIAGFQIRRTLSLVHGWGITHYLNLTKQPEDARVEALLMMLNEAVRFRANAVIGIRYQVAGDAQNFKLMVYGTCVIAERC